LLKLLQFIVPFFDPSVKYWSMEARLLRWLTFVWTLVGIWVLFSASYAEGNATYNDGLYYFKRQLIWIWLGMILFNALTHLPLRYLMMSSHLFLIFGMVLIMATLVPNVGTTVMGATRWLQVGPVTIQPSELVKPFLVIQAARVFGLWKKYTLASRFLWITIFAVILACILKQPNLSTTALCGMTLWLIALASGLPWRYLGGAALSGLLVGVTSILINDYQKQRVLAFLNPWDDPQGNGYQLIQSLLAIGSGGKWGTSFGLSQQKLFYLPIQSTDFIFAVYAEEFGLAGGIFLLLLLLSFATLALWVGLTCRHPIKRLIAIGIMILVVGQSLLNIGVATGTLPTTGLPLPLFSYGGSSVLASLFCCGLLIRVARESQRTDKVVLLKRVG
jgi:cell division protein FtsW